MLNELTVRCSCGVRFCSEYCMNTHKTVMHKRLAGLA